MLILGPVALRRRPAPGTSGGPAQDTAPSSPILRSLLGLLALRGTRGADDDLLMARLWGHRDAEKARAALRVAVHRLRQWIMREAGDGLAVRRTPTGYLLDLGAGRTDAAQFRQLLSSARSAHPTTRADLLTEALGLWRGRVLEDVEASDEDAVDVVALEQDREAAVLTAARTWLDLGHPERAKPLLEPLVHARPLDEPPHALLIEALASAGHQAAALTVYEEVRLRLRDELGVGPGRELSTAFAHVLAQDTRPVVRSVPAVAPAQLPASVTAFTGRVAQLRALDRLMAGHGPHAPVVISAVTGAGGVGKTALAVRWAHRVAQQFPDGQLYADLRGYSAGAPEHPLHAIAAFLRALGLPDEQIPKDVGDAARLYRSVLAGRKMLILLDNVRDPAQARPLLPGSPTCMVVVTSRSRLDGLVAVDGARRVDLDTLPAADAVELLAALVGRARVAAEPGAAVDLARACTGLPLALRITAAHLVGHPERTLAEQAALLRADALGELTVEGDEHAAVRRTFDLSYQRLTPAARRLLRLLGLSPCATFGTAAAAALGGLTVPETGRILRELTAAHLVAPAGPDRYGLHDLMSAYAKERAEREDTPQARERAAHRLMDWYLDGAERAARTLYPFGPRMPVPGDDPRDEHPSGGRESLAGRDEWVDPASLGSLADPAGPRGAHATPVAFASADEAARWFGTERENLLAIAARAAVQGPHHAAWLLANATRLYLSWRRLALDLTRLTDHAQTAAQACGDLTGLAVAALCRTAAHYVHSDDPSGALRHGLEALAACEAAGWREGQAAALSNNAVLCAELGKLDLAISTARHSLECNPATEALILNNLGHWHVCAGNLATAIGHYREALAKYGHLRDEQATMTMANLGAVLGFCGSFTEATDWLDRAMSAACDIGNDDLRAAVHVNQAWLECERGRHHPALEHFSAALDLAVRLQNRRRQAQVHTGIGTARLELDELRTAIDELQQGLRLAQEVRNAVLEVHALNGLATAYHRLGSPTQALRFVRNALARIHECGFRAYEGHARTVLATVLLHDGHVEEATHEARRSLRIHTETGSRPGVMHASRVLGNCCARTGGRAAAHPHWQRADETAAALGITGPEADRPPRRGREGGGTGEGDVRP